MNNATNDYRVYDTEGRMIAMGYESEEEACKAGKSWANGNGEGCVIVSSEDESNPLHDILPDWDD